MRTTNLLGFLPHFMHNLHVVAYHLKAEVKRLYCFIENISGLISPIVAGCQEYQQRFVLSEHSSILEMTKIQRGLSLVNYVDDPLLQWVSQPGTRIPQVSFAGELAWWRIHLSGHRFACFPPKRYS